MAALGRKIGHFHLGGTGNTSTHKQARTALYLVSTNI